MAKVIKLEVDAAGIQEIASEWMGVTLSKAAAQKLLNKIKGRAEEALSRKGFTIISDLIGQEIG